MSTEAVSVLAEDSDHIILEGPSGHLALLVKVFPGRNGQLNIPRGPRAARFFTTYLRRTHHPLLRRLGSSVFGNPSWEGDPDHWMDCATPGELATVLSAHMVFGAISQLFWGDHHTTPFTGSTELFETYPNPVRALESLLTSGGIEGTTLNVQIHPDFEPLTTHLLNARSNLPEIRGRFQHPVFGEVSTEWIVTSPPRCAADPQFPHLHKLFSAFDLHEIDRCTLYSFFLGCFHSASLDSPHPILFVDSYMQGRGKGEIGTALTTLLDKRQSALSMSGTRGPAADEEITAHLAKGGRVLSLQNITNCADWNSTLLSCLATDGAINKRVKFKPETTPFEGIVGMASMVYGEASLHRDILSRIWRVYLPGKAQKLDPEPGAYAKAYRDELIAEILLAHASAAPYNESSTGRFEHFERAAAAAYCALTGHPAAQVRENLAAASRGALGLSTPAVRSLHKTHSDLFFTSDKDVVGGFNPLQTRLDITGARALGKIFHEGEWHDETP